MFSRRTALKYIFTTTLLTTAPIVYASKNESAYKEIDSGNEPEMQFIDAELRRKLTDLNRSNAESIQNCPEASIIKESKTIAPALSDIIKESGVSIKAGMSKRELHNLILNSILSRGFAPAMLGFHGFPACACISIDDEILNGLPTNDLIQDGSLISIETSISTPSAYASQAWSFTVGEASEEKRQLLAATRHALSNTISTIHHGSLLGDIGHSIQSTLEENGESVIREYCGYGMGKKRIQAPQILGYGKRGQGEPVLSGQILNIQVIAKAGRYNRIRMRPNFWTIVSKDGKPGAVTSAMILVGEKESLLLSSLL